MATEGCAPRKEEIGFEIRTVPGSTAALDVTPCGPSDPTPTCPRPLPCASSDPEPS